MVLSEIEKKERARECRRNYKLNNKEKIKVASKIYRVKNSERLKKYNFDRKEKTKEYNKKYNFDRKEEIKETNRNYRNSLQGKKTKTISTWKSLGLILPLDWYSILYDYYIKTDRCEVCDNLFKSNKHRHMDHCHETGEFRWILCCTCNVHDNWKKII